VSLSQDKQKDMAEGSKGGIQLAMKVVPLGQGQYGESLSSLVVDPDADAVHNAMVARQGFTEAEVEDWKGKAPEPWTATVLTEAGLPAQSTLKRRILQVLADHAHGRGMTQAESKRAVIARWYEKGKSPDPDSWTDSWNVVTSLPLACAVGGERWALDQAILSAAETSGTSG
jgi:hypothetical protein